MIDEVRVFPVVLSEKEILTLGTIPFFSGDLVKIHRFDCSECAETSFYSSRLLFTILAPAAAEAWIEIDIVYSDEEPEYILPVVPFGVLPVFIVW